MDCMAVGVYTHSFIPMFLSFYFGMCENLCMGFWLFLGVF